MINNIDLSQFKLVMPESIQKVDGLKTLIDIEVEDDHTFYIKAENDLILSHNCDGNSIASLLINFFYKYWPEVFDRKMLYKVETPIVVAIPRGKNKKKLLFYTQTEYNDWCLKNNLNVFDVEYKKGLAALVDDEYDDIINSPRMTLISKDEVSTESLDIWFGKNSGLRKIELLK